MVNYVQQLFSLDFGATTMDLDGSDRTPNTNPSYSTYEARKSLRTYTVDKQIQNIQTGFWEGCVFNARKGIQFMSILNVVKSSSYKCTWAILYTSPLHALRCIEIKLAQAESREPEQIGHILTDERYVNTAVRIVQLVGILN